jgi:hypothetical protein
MSPSAATGSRVVPAGSGDLEMLHFAGERAGEVRDTPRRGNPQQWRWIKRAGAPANVPANGRTKVPLPDALKGISTVSMKAYIRKTP